METPTYSSASRGTISTIPAAPRLATSISLQTASGTTTGAIPDPSSAGATAGTSFPTSRGRLARSPAEIGATAIPACTTYGGFATFLTLLEKAIVSPGTGGSTSSTPTA